MDKNLGPITFPRIPTHAEERAVIEQAVRDTEAEKGPYLALLALRQHPAWPNVQAGIRSGLEGVVARGMTVTGEEVYRCQGEYRAWKKLLTMADKAADVIAALDQKLAGLKERLSQIPTT